jgi:pantoate--beta-alanine ligase
MHIFSDIHSLQEYLSTIKAQNQQIGCVPTMGALHQGHLSLIAQSKDDNYCTVVTIFVNPTQFNDKKDFENYPRNFDQDLSILNNVLGTPDVVFLPEVKEMYPKEDTRQFNFGELEKVMEGKHRPGHFNGVAQIVSKLFDAVMPHTAYFGEKDFQQLAIIKQLVKSFHYPIKIQACPTLRENDGLAMSSRNTLLSKEERQIASNIPVILNNSLKNSKGMTIPEIKQWVTNEFAKIKAFELEYFEIANENTLQPIEKKHLTPESRAFIAVKLGKIRLIDNLNFYH